jgi:acetyl esterase/lipase
MTKGSIVTEDLSILTRRASAPDQTLSYGADKDQVADIRSGRQGTLRPLVVLLHGGFWKPQYDRHHTEAQACALAAAGWSVLTLEYRRIPGHPDLMLDDLRTALTLLPDRVDQHNGKLLLLGHSAGGHLALWVAATIDLPQLQGVLALAPAANLRLADALNLGDGAVRSFLGSGPDTRPDINPMALPPPRARVTIVQGLADQIVPPSVPESYCAVFPKTRLRSIPDAGHFALIDPEKAAWEVVLEELLALSGNAASDRGNH